MTELGGTDRDVLRCPKCGGEPRSQYMWRLERYPLSGVVGATASLVCRRCYHAYVVTVPHVMPVDARRGVVRDIRELGDIDDIG